MKVPTLYLDTSVIGGYFDAEWMTDTRELWAQAQTGKWRLVTSIVAERELQSAPKEVRRLFAETFCDASHLLAESEEIETLAEAYLSAGVVTRKYADDARHVAIATAQGIRYLVSWNFRHLANVRRETGFNAVNLCKAIHPSVL